MRPDVQLKALLAAAGGTSIDRLGLFAMINLGIVESLASGSLGPADAIRLFYNAANCLDAHKILKSEPADEVMSRGVQLMDLFDCLPPEQAQREYLHELRVMKTVCLDLIEAGRLVA